MLFGIGIGQVSRLVRATLAAESAGVRIAVSGPGAAALADALAVGGARAAIAVDGAGGDVVRVRLIDGDPDPDEVTVLRRLAHDTTPIVVVRRGGTKRIPHILAQDVVESDGEPRVEAVAAAIVRAAPDAAPSLAARLPVLRPAVADRLVSRTALTNAALAASSRGAAPQLPLLTLAQARMLLLLGVSRGETLPRDPQGLARAAGPPLGIALATGLAARECVRRLPFGGPLVRAAVAYGGTRALGAARLRL